jgi:undecaprenyl-diphosphatase
MHKQKSLVLYLALSTAAFVFLTVLVKAESILTADLSILLSISLLRNDSLTEFMKIATSFGGYMGILLVLMTSLTLFIRKHSREAAVVLLVTLASFSVNTLLKEIIRVNRPSDSTLLDLSSYSYPSGHSMAAFTIYVLLALILSKFYPKMTTIWYFVAAALILLVGFSRMYLGVHYFSDVIGGFIAGGIVLLAFRLGLITYREKQKPLLRKKR